MFVLRGDVYGMKQKNYVRVPTEVRSDKNLSANEKLMYGEISALCAQKGYCWANNNYFANMFDVNRRTVVRWVNHLEQCGYIAKDLHFRDVSMKNVKRRITIADPSTKNSAQGNRALNNHIDHGNTVSANGVCSDKARDCAVSGNGVCGDKGSIKGSGLHVTRVGQYCDIGSDERAMESSDENVTYNNTINNNTINNTNYLDRESHIGTDNITNKSFFAIENNLHSENIADENSVMNTFISADTEDYSRGCSDDYLSADSGYSSAGCEDNLSADTDDKSREDDRDYEYGNSGNGCISIASDMIDELGDFSLLDQEYSRFYNDTHEEYEHDEYKRKNAYFYKLFSDRLADMMSENIIECTHADTLSEIASRATRDGEVDLGDHVISSGDFLQKIFWLSANDEILGDVLTRLSDVKNVKNRYKYICIALHNTFCGL